MIYGSYFLFNSGMSCEKEKMKYSLILILCLIVSASSLTEEQITELAEIIGNLFMYLVCVMYYPYRSKKKKKKKDFFQCHYIKNKCLNKINHCEKKIPNISNIVS